MSERVDSKKLVGWIREKGDDMCIKEKFKKSKLCPLPLNIEQEKEDT